METIYKETLEELGDERSYGHLGWDDENFILTADNLALYMCLPKKRSEDARIRLHLTLPDDIASDGLDAYQAAVLDLRVKRHVASARGFEGEYSTFEGHPAFSYSIPCTGKKDIVRVLTAFNL